MRAGDIQVKGLTTRWLLNIIGVVVIVLAVVQIVCSVLIYNFYYNAVQQGIESRISMSSGFLSKNSGVSDSDFEIAAKAYVDEFPDKNALELQVLDKNGNVIVSSRGFLPNDQDFADYQTALQDANGYGKWIGENVNGEKVMAVTKLVPQTNDVSVGAIRFVASLTQIDRNILYNILLLLAVCLVLLAFTVISGTLFLRSIISPIKAITNVAFRIASGNFEDRLPVKDADEIGKLCDTINYMASELQSTEKMKNEFISSVSHELRTPLTVIKGWAETMRGSIENDPALAEKGLDVIVNESARLSGLVEDLLDYSKMQAGRMELNKQKIDILAELGEAVYMYEDIAKQQGIKLEYIEPAILPPVMADPERLKQVFINVIDNAIKYSESGDQVLVEASQHDIYVKITVIDTGCGIAAEDLGRVKERFYKANKTVRGSGIGLAIADEIIKMHDGILEIDSKEGAGTTVRIILPYILSNEQERNNAIE